MGGVYKSVEEEDIEADDNILTNSKKDEQTEKEDEDQAFLTLYNFS